MKRNPLALLLIPVATYLASYLYLAAFHHKAWLWNTVVHESGKLTLLETTLYASHFLGHIPSLVIIALLFSFWFKILAGEQGGGSWKWFSLSAAFVALCFVGSAMWFGVQDTLDYTTLSKQSEIRSESGGSFLLHLPSTLSLFILIPLFIAATQLLIGNFVFWHAQHIKKLAATVGAALAIAVALAPDRFVTALTDPRYLAHSVRELATFPLTFFPIPIAFWLSENQPERSINPRARRGLLLLLLFALPLLAYQVVVPLTSGIESLAQHPTFSEAPLPVPYLLASHYFEHVLDTIFFASFCFALISPRGVNNT